jgi:hypothetical protein
MSLLNDDTRRKLRELNLDEFIEAIDSQSKDITYSTMTFEERMRMAIDHLYQAKFNSKVFLISSSVIALLITLAVASSLILPQKMRVLAAVLLQPNNHGSSPAMTARIIWSSMSFLARCAA